METVKKHSFKIILIVVIGLILVYLFFRKKGNGDGLLHILDRWRRGLQKEIIVINRRKEKRKRLHSILKEKHIEIDRNISSMSDHDLDQYISAFM
jgi:hypothetical protein